LLSLFNRALRKLTVLERVLIVLWRAKQAVQVAGGVRQEALSNAWGRTGI
jgi:hypothetical protein